MARIDALLDEARLLAAAAEFRAATRCSDGEAERRVAERREWLRQQEHFHRQAGCHFYMQVHAPLGLNDIEPHLHLCSMKLGCRKSSFNNQIILTESALGEIEFDMQPSTTDVLHASGNIMFDPNLAWEMLESLSATLRAAGFRHRICMDEPFGKSSRDTNHLMPSWAE